jgi:hypothetical protein
MGQDTTGSAKYPDQHSLDLCRLCFVWPQEDTILALSQPRCTLKNMNSRTMFFTTEEMIAHRAFLNRLARNDEQQNSILNLTLSSVKPAGPRKCLLHK